MGTCGDKFINIYELDLVQQPLFIPQCKQLFIIIKIEKSIMEQSNGQIFVQKDKELGLL